MIPYIAAPWILWVLNSHGLCWTLFPWPRRYRGMIIDAGSSGSRVWIFAWSPGPCQHDALPSMVTPTVVASYQVKGGYGSIPIDAFLVGWTSINPSYDLGFTRYQGFDPSPYESWQCFDMFFMGFWGKVWRAYLQKELGKACISPDVCRSQWCCRDLSTQNHGK